MSSDLEVRIKLAPSIHQKWTNAASARGLTLKGFIASTVSLELIRTGELNPAAESGVTAVTPPAPAKPAKRLDYGPYDPSTVSPPDDETVMVDGEEYYADSVPSKKPARRIDHAAIAAEWPDDDDED